MKNKVAIVGTGFVGASYGYSLVNQGLVDELVLIDVNKDNTIANRDDLIQAVAYLPNQPLIISGDYEDAKDCDIICVTAGVNQKPGETRLQLVEKNTKIMESVIDSIMATGFDGILLIASNPVDILTLVAQKRSGLPKHRVIGSGTVLDSGRLRHYVGEYLGVNPVDVHGYIIGEHGDSSVPTYSTTTIGQQPLMEYVKEMGKDQAGLDECFVNARDAAYKIIEGKGATYYAIGVCLARITKAILRNENKILPCSCYLEDMYGQSGIYTAIPCFVGKDGVNKVQKLPISEEEQVKFNQSCEQLKEIINSIGY